MTEAFARVAASRAATKVDGVFLFITAVSLFFFLLVEGLLIYFAIKYRRRRGSDAGATSDAKDNTLLEIIWVIIPSVAVIAFFAYGYMVYNDVTSPLPGAADINVTAGQFSWEFRYPDGRVFVNELHVPVGRPVKLIMTSRDVIHSFFVPDFRVKQDVLPGRYTYLYLHPDRQGTYDIFCAEYCGVGHSSMRAKLVVMPAEAYAAWAAQPKAGKETASLPEKGKEILEQRGCLGCHSTDGTPKVGPTLKGLFGRTVTMADGMAVTADEGYIRESIYDPGGKIVKGYPNVMPTFKGSLTEEDLAAVIAYIKTLK
jgi:cytochrome c oxidase subunit 2